MWSTTSPVNAPVARVFAAAAAAGTLSAVANILYFAGYQAVVGRHYPQTGIGSIVASSVLPPLLGAAAALWLSRYTRRAGAVFAAVTLAITGLSLLSVFSPNLGEGIAKPDCFDGLVLPMHVVVGTTAAWLVARALRVPRAS